MTNQTVSGQEGFHRRALWFRGPLACTVVLLALGGGATATYGISGESEETQGVFQALCQGLRAETGLGGDAVFFCDPNGQQCHLVSPTGNEYSALGFCADSFGEVQVNRGGALETGVVIRDTTFGTTIGLGGSDGDILCETVAGDKICVNVFVPVPPAPCTGGFTESNFAVRCDTDCTDVQKLLAASVTGNRNQTIAWWLFIDVVGAAGQGQEISEVLSVCPGRAAAIVNPDDFAGATVDFQSPKFVVSTPATFNLSGTNLSAGCATGTTLCKNTSLNKAFCEPNPPDSVCDGR